MKPHLFGEFTGAMADFDIDVNIVIDSYSTNIPRQKVADMNVFVQIEPTEIKDHSQLDKIADKFDLILTWSKDTIAKYPQARFFDWGTTWVPVEDRKVWDKTKNISIIASEKNYLEGHKLRHLVINKFKDKLDLFGRGYRFVENKADMLKDYRFSIIIENVRYENYFTEKIVDCIITGTVPIYWGCPNIKDFYNENGFIFFETLEDLVKIIPTLDEKKYAEMLPYIKENFERAQTQHGVEYFGRMYKKIEEEIKTMGIKKKGLLLKIQNLFNRK
jgi:hypothetical protein